MVDPKRTFSLIWENNLCPSDGSVVDGPSVSMTPFAVGLSDDPQPRIVSATQAANRAIELDENDAGLCAIFSVSADSDC